jgi:hypothetical protein
MRIGRTFARERALNKYARRKKNGHAHHCACPLWIEKNVIGYRR